MKTFVIIPARGGSKGIPGKNLQKVGGVPLVERTVRAALSSDTVSGVFVSTDSDEIARCAEQAGASTIRRPDKISGDTASSEAALLHACEMWRQEGVLPDALVFLQTTSPFTTSVDIDGAVAKLESEQADVVLGVAAHHRFQWSQDADGSLSAVGHNMFNRPRRQELSNRFVETGALYVMRTLGFMESKFRFFGKVVAHELPQESMLEIDSPQDLVIARAIATSSRSSALQLPTSVRAVVFDFDGVMTDDAVYLSEEGIESVRASRRDGMGISLLRKHGIPALVLSKERNAVVQRRCDKLEIECLQGIDNKVAALDAWLRDKDISWQNIVYVGNDVNDIGCIQASGLGIAVADADSRVLAEADWICSRAGGYGAVREVCELLVFARS